MMMVVTSLTSVDAAFTSDTPQGRGGGLLTPRRAAFAAAEALAPGFDGFLPVDVMSAIQSPNTPFTL